MSRIGLLLLLFVVPLGMVLATASSLEAAQDPGDGDHLAVGSWLVESDLGDAEYSPRLVTLGADGTALLVSGRQTTGIGAWQPTGETTAVATLVLVTDGTAAITVRVGLDVASDGRSFAGTYTIEVVLGSPEGETSGQIGPGRLTGARISAEAPGTPAASFEEFFPTPDETPAATPTV